MRLESLGFHAVTATPGCPCPRSTQPQAPSASCPWVSAQRSQDCPRHPPTSPSALAPCCRLAGGGGRQRRVTGGHPGSQTQSQGTGVPGGRKLASSLSSFSGTVPLPEASQPAVAGMEPPARRGLPKVAAETRNSAECESPSLPGGFSLPAPGKGGRVLLYISPPVDTGSLQACREKWTPMCTYACLCVDVIVCLRTVCI